VTSVKLRHSARAIILDEHDRILLCRFGFPYPAVPTGATVVWAAPGGGIEPGETQPGALDRELREEVGLVLDADPPHVWHQEVVASGHATGYDGVINDYFLIRTTSFTPRGTMSDDELTAENITGWQWWRCQDITEYRGTDLFSPRDLATPLIALITDGVPDVPVRLGL
jgi:8-oxo-dGTP diphosphatase